MKPVLWDTTQLTAATGIHERSLTISNYSDSSQKQSLTEIILAIFRLKTALLENGNELVRTIVTDSTNWQVLGALALANHAMTAPMVAESMGMTRQGAQKRLNKLAEDGLVKPHSNPRHDRSPIWELTDTGREAYQQIMSRYDVWLQSLLPQFQSASADLATTRQVLTELEKALHHTDIKNDVLPNIDGGHPIATTNTP